MIQYHLVSGSIWQNKYSLFFSLSKFTCHLTDSLKMREDFVCLFLIQLRRHFQADVHNVSLEGMSITGIGG